MKIDPKARATNAIIRLQGMLKTAIDSGVTTAERIATETGVPKSYVYRVIRQAVPGMTISTAARLCAAIGVSPADLFRERTAAPDAVMSALELATKWAKGK